MTVTNTQIWDQPNFINSRGKTEQFIKMPEDAHIQNSQAVTGCVRPAEEGPGW